MLKHVGLKKLSKTKEKIDLQNLNHFLSFHTTKSEHMEPKIGLSIKNKSGKRKLSRGEGLRSKTQSDPCVVSELFFKQRLGLL